jgi:hypothetical protein
MRRAAHPQATQADAGHRRHDHDVAAGQNDDVADSRNRAMSSFWDEPFDVGTADIAPAEVVVVGGKVLDRVLGKNCGLV